MARRYGRLSTDCCSSRWYHFERSLLQGDVNVERIDGSFLDRRFGEKKGALYKIHLGGPGADFRYIGDDPLLYAKTFEIKSGKSFAQMSDLVSLFKTLERLPRKEFGDKFEDKDSKYMCPYNII